MKSLSYADSLSLLHRLQLVFVSLNAGAMLFEVLHVVFYVTRSPIDNITGNLSNLSFTLILLAQSVSSKCVNNILIVAAVVVFTLVCLDDAWRVS